MNTKQRLSIALFVTLVGSQSLFAFGFGDVTNALSSAQSTSTKATPAVNTQKTDLTSLLVSQLGVSSKQADGGVGSILNYAKSSLPESKFDTLAKAIPNASSLMNMIPNSSSKSGGLMGSLGSAASSLSGTGALMSQFSSLGLDSSMVSKFVPVILQYLQGSGSTDAMSILSSLFKS